MAKFTIVTPEPEQAAEVVASLNCVASYLNLIYELKNEETSPASFSVEGKRFHDEKKPVVGFEENHEALYTLLTCHTGHHQKLKGVHKNGLKALAKSGAEISVDNENFRPIISSSQPTKKSRYKREGEEREKKGTLLAVDIKKNELALKTRKKEVFITSPDFSAAIAEASAEKPFLLNTVILKDNDELREHVAAESEVQILKGLSSILKDAAELLTKLQEEDETLD